MSGSPSSSAKTVRISVQGMNCQHCVQSVQGALSKVPGVQAAQVDLASGEARVTFDPAPANVQQLIQAVKASGFTPAGFSKV